MKEYLRYNPKTGIIYWIKQKNPNGKNQISKVAGTIADYKTDKRCLITFDRKMYLRYRLAFIFMNKPIPKLVDHINRNSLDDRWKNLRSVTKAQNAWNSKINITGVYFCKKKKGFVSKITHQGKEKYIGLFKTRTEAHDAYLKTKRKLHGSHWTG